MLIWLPAAWTAGPFGRTVSGESTIGAMKMANTQTRQPRTMMSLPIFAKVNAPEMKLQVPANQACCQTNQ